MSVAIRVELPRGLLTLAGVRGEIVVRVEGAMTQRALLDALEAQLPVLRGTIREFGSGRRRPFIRFFACGEDWSHAGTDAALPAAVVSGAEVFMVVGAIAGG